jgi:hypothetical protein
LQKLREQHDTREDQIHTLQTAISNSNAHMSKVETEVQRLFEAVLQLQMNDQNKMEKIVQLEENKKMTKAQALEQIGKMKKADIEEMLAARSANLF